MPNPPPDDSGPPGTNLALTRRNLTQKRVRLALVFVLFAIVGSFVTDAQMTRWGLGWYDPVSEFSRLLDGTADRPYAYRVLTPTLVKIGTSLVPTALERALLEPLGEKKMSLAKRAQRRYAQGGDSEPISHFIGYLLVLLSAIGICWTWRFLLSDRSLPDQVPRPEAAQVDTLPALALLLLPLTFGRGGYAYDMPQLLLVSLAFWCFLGRRFALYYVLFVIAMFNKESSLLMASWFLPFALVPSRFGDAAHLSKESAWKHLALHGVFGLPILAGLYWFFRDNGGGPVEWHLVDNLESYLDPSTYVHMVDIYSAGIPVPQGFNLLNILLFGYLLLHAWKHKSVLVRSCFAWSVLTILPLFLAFGFRDEIRVFEIAFPAAFLLGTDTLMRLWSGQDGAASS